MEIPNFLPRSHKRDVSPHASYMPECALVAFSVSDLSVFLLPVPCAVQMIGASTQAAVQPLARAAW